MNERFTLDSTVTEIFENERVNKKLPIFFDLALCSQIKWPFSKMKLKNMMKMTKFPGQELVDAANFILERREAGDKITIPIWRGLPENEAEAAEYVVLIPFISDEENRPAILICPDWENGRQRMMDEGMKMAKTIFELGCQAFILNLRKESEADKIALLTFGEMKASARKLFFHSKRIKDVTHRYDALKCEPEELWIMGASDEDADKTGVFFSGSHYSLVDDSREWLETRIRKLSENAEIEEKINEGEQAE